VVGVSPSEEGIREEEVERGVARLEAVATHAAGKWLADARRKLRAWKEDESTTLTAYKPAHRKVKPVPGVMPEEAKTVRRYPEDPLADLPEVKWDPPPFVGGERLTVERLEKMEWRKNGFLTEAERRIFDQILLDNEMGLAFDETERGTFRDDYFSPYRIATIPHVPWAEKNIPTPPGLAEVVDKIIREKLANGVIEPSTSSYRSKFFLVAKKASGKYRIVHDLQPLNRISKNLGS
jgi:hypothetical protein